MDKMLVAYATGQRSTGESALAYLLAQPDLPRRLRLFQWYPDGVPGVLDPHLGGWLAERAVPEPVTFGRLLGSWSPWRTRLLWSGTPLTDAELRWREIQRWAHSLGTILGSQLVLAG